MKRKLTYYTNMPTPYQLDFIEALAVHFDLKVVFFTARESDRQWDLRKNFNSEIHYTTLRNSGLVRWIQRKIVSFHFSILIFPLLFKDPADFIIINGTYWSPNVVLALLISKFRKKKVFYYGEPVFKSSSKLQSWIKKNILAFPLKNFTDATFAIGKLAIISYRELGYRKNLYNIPYNKNTELFKNSNIDISKKTQLIDAYKRSGEAIILTSGSLIERKGMDTLIKAFLLLPGYTNAKLIIMGDGPELASLKTLSKKDPRVLFVGFQDKLWIPVYFAIADIFAFASRYDGWGLVINEAVASGTAIICSDKVGAAVDLLENRRNAIILDSEDVEGFSHAMKELIENEIKRSEIVKNSKDLEPKLSSAYNAKLVYDICGTT